ncbi:MAG: FGGY family carbohydrate kinase [Bacteroidota bacterium]
MATKVTLIFDIGKTNKKLFLFDKDNKEVYREYQRFEEIPDEDGFLSEDLPILVNWIKERAEFIVSNPDYDVTGINFSTYGASMVHLDKEGNVIAPFYNYLKTFPEDLKQEFFKKHGSEENFAVTTGSPSSGFLNVGLQLIYLKYRKPHLFEKLDKSLYFPQFLSSIFTGEYVSDYTYVGCHTGMWNFKNMDYAQWVKDEDLVRFLTPIVPTTKQYQAKIKGKTVNVGVGVHDSSSAFIPFSNEAKNPFTLISTGTWSVCMNSFNQNPLTKSEAEKDCLHFLSIEGTSIKASRLLLGKELSEQIRKIAAAFECDYQIYKTVVYDRKFKPLSSDEKELLFNYKHLEPERFSFVQPEATSYEKFTGFEHAYHQLIHELTRIQIASLNLVIGDSGVKDLYVDGGFVDNELFISMLEESLPEYNIYPTDSPLGSALGATLLLDLG